MYEAAGGGGGASAADSFGVTFDSGDDFVSEVASAQAALDELDMNFDFDAFRG